MNIAAIVHLYYPAHCAGAEMMLHTILRWLVERGHTATVYVEGGRGFDKRQPPEIDGVEVRNLSPGAPTKIIEKADITFTHLDRTSQAILGARRAKKPLVHLVHNDKQLSANCVTLRDAALVVFNSRWLAMAENWPGPSMVLHPPVFLEDYAVDKRGEAITLMNLTREKGAEVFWSLALRHPSRKFLAVKGAYGAQIVPSVVPSVVPSNVDVWENTPDARAIYSATRVLLMPSSYESYGRVAIEAACSGIPTVAHPTPGLKESLGGAGIFANRDRIGEWDNALRRLDSPGIYERVSAMASRRAAQADPTEGLEALEGQLLRIVG